MQNSLLAKRPTRPLAFFAITPRWPRLLALLVLVLSSAGAWAQPAATYTFAQSSGTYVAATGGTVLGTTANDDTNFSGSIGFTFAYLGTNYTSLSVSPNGLVRFSGTYTGYTGIASSTLVIAALNRDLQGQTGSVLSIQTIGTAPNRTCVVQWAGYRRYNATVGGDNLNFQVRLQETTNVVQMVYGSCPLGGIGTATTNSPQVGINGATATDYQARTTTTDWTASTAAAANTATMTLSATVGPVSGLTFTYTPPVIACPAPNTLSASAVQPTSATLNWLSSAPATGSGTFTVEYGLSGFTPGTGTIVPNLTGTSYNVSGLTPGTGYAFYVTQNCTAGNGNSTRTGPQAFTTPITPPDFTITRNTGTAFASIQATGTGFTGWSSTISTDDNVSGSTPIGFSFQYLGQTLTNFRVSTNGWLSFNTTQVPSGTNNYDNNLGNASANTLLAPFWEDLVLQGNAGTAAALAAAKIKYQVDGTAPNRVLTVEWAEMETFGNPGPNLNFQVKLSETSNEISYVYGNMSGFDGSANYTYSYSVGLSGALASTGQYLAQQAPNSAYFLNSNAGTVNTGANALNIAPSCFSSLRFVPGTFVAGTAPTATAPANDEPANATALVLGTTAPTDFCAVYTSASATATTGITACTATTPGTPDDDVWFSFTLPATSNITVTLRSSGGYDGVLQLFSGAPGSLTPVACSNATGNGLTENYTNATLAAATYYVRVYHSGTGSGTSGTFVLAAYATPAPPANDECAGAVVLTSNPTTCTPLSGTTLGATATAGVTACSATTPGTADDDVWFSFVATGGAGTFTVQGASGFDAVLQLYSGACGTLTSIGCINGTSTGGAEVGTLSGLTAGQTYYARVYHAGAGAGSGNFTICLVQPTCTDPNSLTASNITTTTADLTFTAGNGAVSYVVTYTPAGGTATTVTPAPTASPVALSGLTPGTVYTVTLQQNCTGGQQSGTLTTTFTTASPPPANDECAGAVTLTSAVTCTATSGTVSGATQSLAPILCNGFTGGTPAQDVWYQFTATGTTHTIAITGTFDGVLEVFSGACGATANVGCSDVAGNNETLTLNALTAGTVYRLRYYPYTPNPTTRTFTICVTEPTACAAPTALATNTITTTSANVTFTASASATSYVVTYTPAGGTATTVTPNPTASPVALSGLTPATAYTVSIVSNCAAGATSSPVTTTFTTATPAPQDLTVTNGQNVTATGPYNNITVQNGGTLTLSGATSATGAVQVQAGGLLITNCQALTGSGSFALQTGAELRICDPAGIAAAGATGTIQLAGTRTFAPDASYTYNGTAAQVTGSGLPGTVRNLTVNNATGLTLSQGVSIGQVARLQSGNLSTGGQSFTLLSSATGTALVDNTGGIVTGTGTMQRAVTNAVSGPAYRHFSSPVASTTLADLSTAGFSPTFNPAYNSSATPSLVTPFPTVFGYDQSRIATVTSTYGPFDKGWFSPAGGSDVMQPTRGYTVNAPATATPIDFVGTFNNAAQNSGSLSRGTDAQAGWQLLGNPYPSPLDWSTVAAGQRPGMDGAMYVYQSTGQYAGTYRTYDNGVGASPLIVAGSGYFARVSTPGSTGAVNLTNANRVTTFGTEPAFGRGTADTRAQLHLQLSGAGLTDETYLYQEAGATTGVDAQYDAVKLANPAGLDLASLNGTTQLAINGLPLPGTAEVVVPLALRVPQGGSFGFEVAGLTNFGTATVYLRDALTGTQQLLLPGTRYSFALATATAGTGRFSVVFRAANVTATRTGLTAATVSVYPNPAHGHFTVLLPPLAGQHQVQATLLNVLGQVVLTRTIGLTAAGATADFSTQPLAKGVYLLRLQAENQVLSKTVVVE